MSADGRHGLAARLAARIAAEGPLPIAAYMEACLCDPEHGYYMRRDPLGAAGDFTTSPEISQIFGELIGLWCAETWRSMGSPDTVQLVELGPGRGTLMADALRAAKQVPAFSAAIRPVLVETSPALTRLQRGTLGEDAARAQWHGALAEVPPGPTIAVANEFLDALPVRQLQYEAGTWKERCVGFSEGRFTPCLRAVAASDVPAFAREHPPADGDIVELRPAAGEVARELGRRARTHPLAGLLIDYGHDHSAIGDTFQAVCGHKPADPFATPGEADLTAHVDFGAFAAAAREAGLAVHGPMAQGRFLLSLGLAQRARRLIAAARDADTAKLLESGARRLADPAQMGELFRVISIAGPDLPVPPAFEGSR
ncbi:MAG: class I SAM-dependent methyltransferase [Hyphomicrobiales bacterium]